MKKINFLMKTPKDCYLAFSGGVDSSVLLHLLLERNSNVILLTVDHLDETSKKEIAFCKETAVKFNLPFVIKTIGPNLNNDPLETYWSKERNKIFKEMNGPVLVGHTLSDAVEWYVMSSMQGLSKVLSSRNENIYRPLIATHKDDIHSFANNNRIKYIYDINNLNPDFCLRNKVRHHLINNIRICFPGINTTVKKLVIKKHKKLISEKQV